MDQQFKIYKFQYIESNFQRNRFSKQVSLREFFHVILPYLKSSWTKLPVVLAPTTTPPRLATLKGRPLSSCTTLDATHSSLPTLDEHFTSSSSSCLKTGH